MNKILYNLARLVILIGGAAFLISIVPAEAARTQSATTGGYFTSVGDSFSTIYYNSGFVDIGASASALAQLYVQGLSGSATSTFSVASSTGIKTFDISAAGTTTLKQYQGFGTPTVATSTGAGTVAATSTVMAGSTDLAGAVMLVTGSAPVANATIFTFTSASSTLPFCVTQPMNQVTSILSASASSTFVASTTTGFALKSGTSGLSATTTYLWGYLCN